MKLSTKICLIVTVLATTIASAEDINGNDLGKLTATPDGTLIFKSSSKEIKIPKILSPVGELELTKFNNKPALNYLSDASSTSFDVNYTLIMSESGIKVDCAYADIRSHINGAVIRKSICGLNKEINEETYLDIFPYSDKWQETAEKINLSQVLDTPSKYTEFLIEKTNKSKIFQGYNKDMLLGGETETVLTKDGESTSFGKKIVYIIYDLKGQAYALDIQSTDDPDSFERINID